MLDDPHHTEHDFDPAVAGATGLALLNAHADGETAVPEEIERAVDLIAFALRHVPHHPCSHLWRYRSAGALTYLAKHHESQETLSSALAALALVAGDPAAPADLAELAAVDAAELTKVRLATADLTAEDARRHMDALAGYAAVVRTSEELTAFQWEVAFAHKCAYQHTLDVDDLVHAANGLTTVLAELSEVAPDRSEALEALALVQEERHRRGGDQELIDAAITAAAELRSLVPDPPAATYACALMAGLLTTRYLERGAAEDADDALAAYAVARAQAELDDEHVVYHAVLSCIRGADLGDVEAMSEGVRVLAETAGTSEEHSAWLSGVLAETHAVLARLAGADHLWHALDWASVSLAAAVEEDDGTLQSRVTRLDVAETAAAEFGVHTVLGRYDVRSWLTDAERAVLDAPPGTSARLRALLVVRLAFLHSQWMLELTEPGDDLDLVLGQLCEVAEVVRRDLPEKQDQDALDGLVAYLRMLDHAYVTAGPLEPLNLDDLRSLYDLARSDEPSSEVDEIEFEVIQLARALATAFNAGQDFRALTGDIVAVAWRIDELPPCAERDRLESQVQLLLHAVGPPTSNAPRIPAEMLNPASGFGFGSVFSRAADLRAAIAEGDLDAALSIHQTIEQAAAGEPPGSPQRLLARMASGVSIAAMRDLLPSQPDELDAAIALAEEKWADSGRPDSALSLGHLLRRRDRAGDRARSRELGLAAVEVNGNQVTAWCLADEAHDDLVRVLEGRRAASAAAVPQVFGPDEVRAALWATNVTLLIYLLPHNEAHGGTAVLVPADGTVGVRPLPNLRTEQISRFRTACETLRADARTAPRLQAWRAELTELCAWAWEAAGALFEPLRGKRLALVPVGDLGLVPWEAAYREVEGDRRFLLQDNEITLVPAARFLTPSSAAVHTGALFVGNPGRDDPAAAVLAESLRDDFHPDGAFLGGHGGPPRPWRQAACGAGTPDEVRAAMQNGLRVLHLGCRSTSCLDAPGKSSVSLHGGELVPPPAEVDLVTLTEHVLLGTVHDDTCALPARFLANGARHVLAARWRPSHDLLRRVHALMAEEGSAPGAALRAAQLELLQRSAIDEWTAIAHHGA